MFAVTLFRFFYLEHNTFPGCIYLFTVSPPMQTLSLQRQMMENLIIAKARQDAVSFSCCCQSLHLCCLIVKGKLH